MIPSLVFKRKNTLSVVKFVHTSIFRFLRTSDSFLSLNIGSAVGDYNGDIIDTVPVAAVRAEHAVVEGLNGCLCVCATSITTAKSMNLHQFLADLNFIPLHGKPTTF